MNTRIFKEAIIQMLAENADSGRLVIFDLIRYSNLSLIFLFYDKGIKTEKR